MTLHADATVPETRTSDPDWRNGARPPRLVADRGVPRVRREDTLPSVAVAEALGADAVAVDVRSTADGVPVLLHDETLGRMWGDGRRVRDVDWCEVARLGNGLDRIPRLDAVLERLDGCRAALVVRVVDAEDARVAAQAVATWTAASAGSTSVAWRGTAEALAAVRSVLPAADVWLAWASLDVPDAADLEPLRPTTLDVDLALVTAATVAAAHALGLRVAVHGVQDAAPARWAAALGVDALVTDDVGAVHVALAEGAASTAVAREPSETEVGARAQGLAHRVAHEVIAWTREHPVGGGAAGTGGATVVGDVGGGGVAAEWRIEHLVRARLRATFPAHGVTGAAYGTAPGDRHHWWVDAVDDTTNLHGGVPWTATSLCLTRGGRPLIGVVADPWRGEVLEARRGRGAVLRDRELRLDDVPVPLAGAVVGTAFDGLRPWPGFTAFTDALADRGCVVRVPGAAALTIAQVAAGRGIGACVPAFDPVVHGAAVLLVHEAGGVVLTRGGPVDGFPTPGEPLLVAHPGAADELHGLWTCSLGW